MALWLLAFWQLVTHYCVTVVRECNLRNLFLSWQLLQPASLVQLSTFARAWWLAYCFRAPEQCNCICTWEFAKNHSSLQIKEKTFMEKVGDKSLAWILVIYLAVDDILLTISCCMKFLMFGTVLLVFILDIVEY